MPIYLLNFCSIPMCPYYTEFKSFYMFHFLIHLLNHCYHSPIFKFLTLISYMFDLIFMCHAQFLFVSRLVLYIICSILVVTLSNFNSVHYLLVHLMSIIC